MNLEQADKAKQLPTLTRHPNSLHKAPKIKPLVHILTKLRSNEKRVRKLDAGFRAGCA